MKRMNEVFELPTNAAEVLHFLKAGDKEFCESISHAINHVDALADALADLIDGVTNRSQHDHINNQIIAAVLALAAYRGEK